MGDFAGGSINSVIFFKKDICFFQKAFFAFLLPFCLPVQVFLLQLNLKKEELCFM